jgi:DNA polymerase I-like protein with 3'-5' exonuclease and polymerase domains
MYDTFMQGKDLYSEIASKAFNKAYEECREFNADGSTNKQGKERRTQAKSILLGVLYGRGEASIAEQLNCSVDKAKSIKQSVFRAFPAIKKFEQDSLNMAYEVGYVTTVCGRKRRLPDLQLEEYEFKLDGSNVSDDILDFDAMNEPVGEEVPIERQNFYLRKLQNCRFNEKRKIFEQANKEGIWIVDNGKKIADATRQCVNSRIQGSAADMSKIAGRIIYDNKRLRELGFKLLIPIHDEYLAECPKENVKECSKLFSECMCKAAEDLGIPIKCDVAITDRWYGSDFEFENPEET